MRRRLKIKILPSNVRSTSNLVWAHILCSIRSDARFSQLSTKQCFTYNSGHKLTLESFPLFLKLRMRFSDMISLPMKLSFLNLTINNSSGALALELAVAHCASKFYFWNLYFTLSQACDWLDVPRTILCPIKFIHIQRISVVIGGLWLTAAPLIPRSLLRWKNLEMEGICSFLTLVTSRGGVLPRILDRGVPRRFLNPNPI